MLVIVNGNHYECGYWLIFITYQLVSSRLFGSDLEQGKNEASLFLSM